MNNFSGDAHSDCELDREHFQVASLIRTTKYREAITSLIGAALVADIVLALTVTDRVSWWLAASAVALVGINLAAFAIWTVQSI